jgi:Arc/MetJ-type ribon-helix-helix transcriptional regulator
MYDPRLIIRIPKDLLTEVEALVGLSGHSKSDVIRACLKKALPQIREFVEAQLEKAKKRSSA